MAKSAVHSVIVVTQERNHSDWLSSVICSHRRINIILFCLTQLTWQLNISRRISSVICSFLRNCTEFIPASETSHKWMIWACSLQLFFSLRCQDMKFLAWLKSKDERTILISSLRLPFSLIRNHGVSIGNEIMSQTNHSKRCSSVIFSLRNEHQKSYRERKHLRDE
jgi:hypothetical protein